MHSNWPRIWKLLVNDGFHVVTMGKKKNRNKKSKQIRETKPIASQPAALREVHPLISAKLKVSLIILAILLLVGAGFFLYSRKSNTTNLTFGQYKDFNVLLITLDTLRADHLPAYGYTQVRTPHLDQLAERSYIFEDAISHVPLTFPAHTSMFTSLLPISHGVRDNSAYLVDPKETTLAEILKTNGYTTSAFVSAFVLDSRFQLDQGFDFYFDHFDLGEFKSENIAVSIRDIQRRGDETEFEAAQWLKKNKEKRFFTWVHLYDPHDPYSPPEPYLSEYSTNLYDAEIAFTDSVVGRLLEKLEEFGLKDRTIIVITGDHGEGLNEHSEATHGSFVYNTTQHVPLFIHLPGTGQERVKGVAGHIDIMPTLLELLGIRPLSNFQGHSLLPLMNGKVKGERSAYSESIYCQLHYGWSPLKAITTEKYRYIDAPKPELYDRIQDPGETKNFFYEQQAIAKVLKTKLEEIEAANTRKDLRGPQKMDPETEEKLRALGYITGKAVSTAESLKIDPKDKLHLAAAMQRAWDAARKNDYTLALQRVQVVLREDPNVTDAHFLTGTAYAGLEKYPEAIDELMKTISQRPDHSSALYNLGYAYEQMNRWKEAEYWYQQVLKLDSRHLFASLKLGHLYRRLNEDQKAKPYFMKAVDHYKGSLEETTSPKSRSSIYSNLGETYFASGQSADAVTNLKAAIRLTPDTPTLHYNLAQIYEAQRNFTEAIAEYKKEIEIAPKNFKAFNDLGLIYRRLNQFENAVFCFQKVIELLPDDPRGYILLSSTYQRLGKDSEANQVRKLMQQKTAST